MAKEFQSLRGLLLLDGGQLRGSSFHRAVVLVCHHDEDGAFGLILNQKSHSKPADAFSGKIPHELQAEPVFIGGPVGDRTLTYLHSDRFLLNASVMPNLHMGHDFEEVIELKESMSTTQRLRIFSGYSGWGSGQLDNELRHGAWLLHQATVDLVFDEEIETLWKRILLAMGWTGKLLADSPDDLSLN